jgi:hypothetical protein
MADGSTDSHAVIGDDTSVRFPLWLAQLVQRLGLGWAADVLALAIARRALAASMGPSNHWPTSLGCQSIYVDRLGCHTPHRSGKVRGRQAPDLPSSALEGARSKGFEPPTF